VTVLTGFLGSGKTTLLNHIRTAAHGKKLAVIETGLGEVCRDLHTKCQIEEDIFEMVNGCICCTVRQDLIAVLNMLAKKAKSGLRLDGIVIKTAGTADPAPVAKIFFVDDDIKAFCRLDGIVTLIDAKHVEQHLDEKKPEGAENESVEQVAFADRMLLNKTDLVTEADLDRIEARLRAINKFAPIQRCCQSEVSVDSVLDIRAFDLERTLEMNPEFLDNDGEHQHDTSLSCLSISQPGDVDLESVQEWVGWVLRTHAVNIYRMKGVLSIAHAKQKFVCQAVHTVFNGTFAGEWVEAEVRESKLVFIGKNLDNEALKSGFAACAAASDIEEETRKRRRTK
jgi:G3E family GTPase